MQLGEDVLGPLKKWRWQKRLFGLRILGDDLDGAQSLLDGLSTNSPNEINFNAIQQINMKRIKPYDPANPITQGEIDQLRTLALAPYPSSGYARSLYRLLTGDRLTYDLPDFSGGTVPRSQSLTAGTEVLLVYPNPTNDYIYLDYGDIDMVALEIYSLDGALQYSKQIRSSQVSVDIAEFDAGMYILNVIDEDGKEICKKIFKH